MWRCGILVSPEKAQDAIGKALNEGVFLLAHKSIKKIASTVSCTMLLNLKAGLKSVTTESCLKNDWRVLARKCLWEVLPTIAGLRTQTTSIIAADILQ